MKKKTNFTQVPNSLLSDHRLTHADKIVYIGLISFDFKNAGYSYPGLKALSKKIDIHPKNISRHLRQLRKLKYIEILRQANASNFYKFPPPPEVPPFERIPTEPVNPTTGGLGAIHQDVLSVSSNLRRNNTMERNSEGIPELKIEAVVSPNVETTPTASGSAETFEREPILKTKKTLPPAMKALVEKYLSARPVRVRKQFPLQLDNITHEEIERKVSILLSRNSGSSKT